MPPNFQQLTSLDALVLSEGGAYQVDWRHFPLPENPGPPPVPAGFKLLPINKPLTSVLRVYDYDRCTISVVAPGQNITVSQCNSKAFDYDLTDEEEVLLGHLRPQGAALAALQLQFDPPLVKLGARVSAFADAGSIYIAQLEVRLEGQANFQVAAAAPGVVLSSARGNAPRLAVSANPDERIVEARFSVRDPVGASALQRVVIGRLIYLPG